MILLKILIILFSINLFHSQYISQSVPNIFIGGNFRAINDAGVTMHGIGMYNTDWNALGEGFFDSGYVHKVVLNDSSLYFVGHFRWNKNRDTLLSNIARYDLITKKWNPIGGGCNGIVMDIVINGSTIIVGGEMTICWNFNTENDTNVVIVNNIAIYREDEWQDLGHDGFNGNVTQMTLNKGVLFTVGLYQGIGYFQIYIQNSWQIVATLLGNPGFSVFNCIRSIGDYVYVGGQFNIISGQKTFNGNNLAKFDPRSMEWDWMLGGVNTAVYTIEEDLNVAGNILVGGYFSKVGYKHYPANGIASFNGTDWDTFGYEKSEMNCSVLAISSVPGGMFVGGDINSFQNLSVTNIAFYNYTTKAWDTTYGDYQFNGYIIVSLILHENIVYTFGERIEGFTGNVFGQYSLDGDLEWGVEYHVLLKTGHVYDIQINETSVYVGGIFYLAGNVVVNNIAEWDGKQYHPLGTGLVGVVLAIAIKDDDIYCAGQFNKTEMPTISNLAKYNTKTKTWHDMSGGVPYNSGIIYSISVIGDNLYIGGSFVVSKTYYNLTYEMVNLMMWNMEQKVYRSVSNETLWIALNFVYNTVFKVYSNGTTLIIAGNFCLGTHGHIFYHIAAYDTIEQDWKDIMNPCNIYSQNINCSEVTVYTLYPYQNYLYIGGDFNTIEYTSKTGKQVEIIVNNVAFYDGARWQAMSSGMDNDVLGIYALNPSNVWAIGNFKQAGGSASRNVAKWNGNGWQSLGTITYWREDSIARVIKVIPAIKYKLADWVIVFLLFCAFSFVASFCMVVYEILLYRRSRTKVSHRKMKNMNRIDLNESSPLIQSPSEPIDLGSSGWLVNYKDVEIMNPPIGKGSYSVVNKAYLKGTLVACKTYFDNYTSNVVEDFKREVRNLIKLRHPNIVLFIGASNQPLCIITEFATRGCLYDVINQTPQELTLDRMKEIFMDCCRGLEYLHSQDVLHRDLKSQNILITGNWVAKVADFGISRPAVLQTMTMGVGTTRWAAPEILKNKEQSGGHYTTKADVYSFGIIIWECVVKKIPWFDVPFDFMIEDKVLKGETLLIPNYCPLVLKAVMLDCWKFEPNERPSFFSILKVLEKSRLEGNIVFDLK